MTLAAPGDGTDAPLRSETEVVSEVGAAIAHDSAERHVRGSATYIDDIREPAGTLHIAAGYADATCGRLRSVDLDSVRGAPGVGRGAAGFRHSRRQRMQPVHWRRPHPCRIGHSVSRPGRLRGGGDQPPRGETGGKARPHRSDENVPTWTWSRRPGQAGRCCRPTSSGAGRRGRQSRRVLASTKGPCVSAVRKHFYLEGQVALAVPGEAGEMHVHSSTNTLRTYSAWCPGCSASRSLR